MERLRVILSYLHENYGEKITLEDVAKQVGLCKSECCRFFRRQMRQSLFEYLLDYRIGRSLPLLKAGRLTVAEVASRVGFSNPAYFSKVFRTRMKLSPREYQKQGALKPPRSGKEARREGGFASLFFRGRPCACFAPQEEGPLPLLVLCGWGMEEKLPSLSQELPPALLFSPG